MRIILTHVHFETTPGHTSFGLCAGPSIEQAFSRPVGLLQVVPVCKLFNQNKEKPLKIHTRKQKLELEITRLYAQLEIGDVEENETEYQEVTTEMFRVLDSKLNGVKLRHLFNDEIYEPVKFPETVHALLIRNDTFLMTLGNNGGTWYVIYMSPPYSRLPS